VISNTHLMGETTPALVREGYRQAVAAAGVVGVPVVAVVAEEGMVPRLDAGLFACPVFPLRRRLRPPFDQPRYQRTTGPLFVLT
jgi:hypothetical protein